MAGDRKTWWAPVWRGLVADPAGTHLRALGKALGLLIYLIVHADRTSGVVRQRQATIARAMGFSLRTVGGWMRRLRERGYISVTGTGRAPAIRIARWRPLGPARQNPADQIGNPVPISSAETGHRPERDLPKRKDSGGEIERAADPNKSLSTRCLLPHHGAGQKRTGPTGIENGVVGRSRQELLAGDLASGLDDEAHVARYLTYAETYPEHLLRRLLSDVRAVPEREIKRSRAALFRFLLTHHADEPPTDPRD